MYEPRLQMAVTILVNTSGRQLDWAWQRWLCGYDWVSLECQAPALVLTFGSIYKNRCTRFHELLGGVQPMIWSRGDGSTFVRAELARQAVSSLIARFPHAP